MRVFASGESSKADASAGTGLVRSLFANVSSVSYMPLVSVWPVSSYSRPGSIVLRSKLESITSVPPPVAPPPEPPEPHAATPSATAAAAATSVADLRPNMMYLRLLDNSAVSCVTGLQFVQ